MKYEENQFKFIVLNQFCCFQVLPSSSRLPSLHLYHACPALRLFLPTRAREENAGGLHGRIDCLAYFYMVTEHTHTHLPRSSNSSLFLRLFFFLSAPFVHPSSVLPSPRFGVHIQLRAGEWDKNETEPEWSICLSISDVLSCPCPVAEHPAQSQLTDPSGGEILIGVAL
jgi:hypothetical protein